MHTEEARDRALYDFALARQLGADAFPRLYLQTAEDYLHLISQGYSAFDQVHRLKSWRCGIVIKMERDQGACFL